MAFNTDISHYAGSVTGKDTAITSFLRSGVKWVINQIEKSNPELLPLFAQASVINNSPTTLTLSTNSKIIDVVRLNADDGTAEALKCSPVNAAYRSNVVNTDSIYYAGKDSPVYYIDNAVLTVKPTTTATQTATVSIVLPDATVAYDGTSISNFPSELYHAVVLYASVQLLHNKMASLNILLPSDLDSDTTVFDAIADVSVDLALSSSLPTAISMGSTGLPSAITVTSALPSPMAISSSLPTGIDVSAVSLPVAVLTINTALPSGIAVSSALPTGFTSSLATSLPTGYSVTSTLPSSIAIGTSIPTAIDVTSVVFPTLFSLSTSIPTIVMPDISADFQDAMDKAKNLIDDAVGGTGSASSAQTWLADEDEEMTQATVQVASQELQRASSVLGKWQQDISKAQTGFQGDMQKHQEDVTKETQRIQADAARFTALLGKESGRIETELGKYQAEVQKEGQRVQTDVANFTAEAQEASQKYQTELAVYSAEVQKESQRIQSDLAKYTSEVTKEGQRVQVDTGIYTAEVQKEGQRIQAESSRYTAELEKEGQRVQNAVSIYTADVQREGQRIQAETSLYTTELGLKSTQMQQEVSAYTNLLGKETARIQQESGNYSAELQKENARVQNELAKYNANLQKKVTLYTTIISKLNTDYQWLQSQYQVVKQELMEFMAPYAVAGMSDSTVERVRR